MAGENFAAMPDRQGNASGSILMKLGLTFLLLAAIGAGLFFLFNYFQGLLFGEMDEVVVPSVQGKSLEEASSLLTGKGLKIEKIGEGYDEKVQKESVMSQDPQEGKLVKKGRIIRVMISKGPLVIEVPEVRGLSLREATLALLNARLEVGKVEYSSHPTAQKESVLDQDPPAGSKGGKSQTVNLVVSKGPLPAVAAPALVGHFFSEAAVLLEHANLRVGEVVWRVDSESRGKILRQNPAAGTKVPAESMVSMEASLGSSGESQEFHQGHISLILPAFQGEEEVRVLVRDEMGTHQAYRATHRGREKIDLIVSSLGTAQIEVYVGKSLLTKGTIE